MFELTNLDAIQICMASPEQVLNWSHGEVSKPETINYRTLKPERDGLFCERIFGPTKDWECNCGKYKRVKYKDKHKICEKCGVEVTRAKVRRERMGHIQLAAPVSHIWYFKGIPSRMGMLLDISPRSLEKVLYFANFIVLDPGSPDTGLKKHELITDARYREVESRCGKGSFVAKMGAEAVKQMLQELDLEELSRTLKEEIAVLIEKERDKETEGQKRARAVKRLEVVEAFRSSGNKPEWMILDVVPVIPPDLRPMVQLDGGRFATSDLNDLYRRVINRNNRLRRLLDLGAPDIIVRNEKRMLQEAVDALIDNGRRGRPVTGPGNRALKSLSDFLRGKQGRFRQNLLGKRVDYSGRSVIVVGPELKLYQCGLPKEMALELFKPFVMERLTAMEVSHNVKSAKKEVERLNNPLVWDILEEVIREHPVLLNRAPTLHRLGIQAFEPVLVEGKAMKLHPLTCTAYNADFDGDQMAVHVPLSMEAQAEARFLMLAHNNILKPQDGKPVMLPGQDMVIGCYYLTLRNPEGKGAGRVFRDEDEAHLAYAMGELSLQAPIKVRVTRTFNGETGTKLIETTLGRLIFNESIPQNLGNRKRECLDDMFALEVDELVGKKQLGNIVDQCFRSQGEHRTAEVLDNIKNLGFRYSTRGAVTVAVGDITVPDIKDKYLKEADEKVGKINGAYHQGLMTDDERYNRVIEVWNNTTKELRENILPHLGLLNPIRMMIDSGARGSTSQLGQLAGIRGIMASPSGKSLELPIRSNFREGLSVLEFFLSSHGSRKALADTALRTADSGYLTRRLVDVSQEVIVREEDCFESRGEPVRGVTVTDLRSGDGRQTVETLEERLRGRTAAEDILDPQTGEVLVHLNEAITHEKAKLVAERGITKVQVRSVLTCKSENGVCSRCYGQNLAHGGRVDIGEAVGIIAAQAIGEPGTQLTMRTFHTGGIASGDDITQGLPRVEELFEARKPKREAVLAEISGIVKLDDSKRKRELTIRSEEDSSLVKVYQISYDSKLKVRDGDHVEAGAELVEGSVNPHDLLRILGVKAVQEYLLREVLAVYRIQGVAVADKHIEIIVRQMLRKVRVEDGGDTDLLPGSLVDIFRYDEENRRTIERDGRPAMAKRILLGITKASLATESFLSAASFQETTRVLTEAAIKGKVDPLLGLKENVIIGKLIPAGTGLARYKDIQVEEQFAY